MGIIKALSWPYLDNNESFQREFLSLMMSEVKH